MPFADPERHTETSSIRGDEPSYDAFEVHSAGLLPDWAKVRADHEALGTPTRLATTITTDKRGAHHYIDTDPASGRVLDAGLCGSAP